ncbi:hypothetical protein BKA61DRAFT_636292 [Leptodontidium sp. MPI-SDFR-AT-0119]|nr:hypothetical protein BKA61DRAFT_636292 [Leptodontidium sp. MPI-SDFR-AT-0119]
MFIRNLIYNKDPYAFLTTFNTILLIDDLSSIAGPIIIFIVSTHDNDSLDLYFMNYKSTNSSSLNKGITTGGYKGLKRVTTVTEIFARPYLIKLKTKITINSIPLDDIKSVLLLVTKKLNKFDEALEELNDKLSELVEGKVRDISEILGVIVKRLNHRRASGEVKRTAHS